MRYQSSTQFRPRDDSAHDLNVACRLTGRAAFRKGLLAREGTLIDVPVHLAEQSVAKLVAFLQPQIDANAV